MPAPRPPAAGRPVPRPAGEDRPGFPVESHTSTLLAHWLPAWRAKRDPREFTRLLSRRELRALLPPEARIRGGLLSPTFTAFYERVEPSEPGRSSTERVDAHE